MPEEFIHHYKVIRKLGAGAMGEVFLCEDPRLEREVAVKLLSTSCRRSPSIVTGS